MQEDIKGQAVKLFLALRLGVCWTQPSNTTATLAAPSHHWTGGHWSWDQHSTGGIPAVFWSPFRAGKHWLLFKEQNKPEQSQSALLLLLITSLRDSHAIYQPADSPAHSSSRRNLCSSMSPSQYPPNTTQHCWNSLHGANTSSVRFQHHPEFRRMCLSASLDLV